MGVRRASCFGGFPSNLKHTSQTAPYSAPNLSAPIPSYDIPPLHPYFLHKKLSTFLVPILCHFLPCPKSVFKVISGLDGYH